MPAGRTVGPSGSGRRSLDGRRWLAGRGPRPVRRSACLAGRPGPPPGSRSRGRPAGPPVFPPPVLPVCRVAVRVDARPVGPVLPSPSPVLPSPVPRPPSCLLFFSQSWPAALAGLASSGCSGSWPVACRNRSVSWSRIGPVDLPGHDRGEHRVTGGRLSRRPGQVDRSGGAAAAARAGLQPGPGRAGCPRPSLLPGPAPPGRPRSAARSIWIWTWRAGHPLLAGVHVRRDQPLTRLLQRVVPALRRGPGIFRAGPLGQRVQDHRQAGRALGRQVPLQPPGATQRGFQPQRPVREPAIIGIGGGPDPFTISRASLQDMQVRAAQRPRRAGSGPRRGAGPRAAASVQSQSCRAHDAECPGASAAAITGCAASRRAHRRRTARRARRDLRDRPQP